MSDVSVQSIATAGAVLAFLLAAAAGITTELLTFSPAPTRVIVRASAQREGVP